ncbi:Uncharacterised protein [Chlamydia trachomatis]|nr:Uncharacterised protein [Chlamydia trachomatis]
MEATSIIFKAAIIALATIITIKLLVPWIAIFFRLGIKTTISASFVIIFSIESAITAVITIITVEPMIIITMVKPTIVILLKTALIESTFVESIAS